MFRSSTFRFVLEQLFLFFFFSPFSAYLSLELQHENPTNHRVHSKPPSLCNSAGHFLSGSHETWCLCSAAVHFHADGSVYSSTSEINFLVILDQLSHADDILNTAVFHLERIPMAKVLMMQIGFPAGLSRRRKKKLMLLHDGKVFKIAFTTTNYNDTNALCSTERHFTSD